MRIHKLKTRLVNSYIVEYQTKILVVDVASGCHHHVSAFITGELHRKLEDIALITCTHDDLDHLGGVGALSRLSGAPVGLPYASKSFRRKFLNDPQAFYFRFLTSLREAFRPRAWTMYANPRRSLRSRTEIEKLIRDDPNHLAEQTKTLEFTRVKHGYSLPGFDDWLLIHTPGHSWDSCCFYHRQSASLLSGDTLLGSARRGRLVAPAILANPDHLKQSYQRLSELEITRVYPGHGSMIEGRNLIQSL